MKRARVNDLRVRRVHGHRVKISQLGIALGRNPLPSPAGVARAIDAVEGSRDQRHVVCNTGRGTRRRRARRRRQRQCANIFPGEARRTPIAPAVGAAKNPAARSRLARPRRCVHHARVARIDHDRRDHRIEARSRAAAQLPMLAAVIRSEYVTVGSAQEKAPRICGVLPQRHNLAAFRTQGPQSLRTGGPSGQKSAETQRGECERLHG